MLDTPEAAADVVELMVGLGLVLACYLNYKLFRGGIMSRPFEIILAGAALYTLGNLIGTLITFQVVPKEPYDLYHISLEVIFVLTLFYGFWVFYKNWVAPKVQTPRGY